MGSKAYKVLRTGLWPLTFKGHLIADALSEHYLLQVFRTATAYVVVAARTEDGFQAAITVPTIDNVVDFIRLFDGTNDYGRTFAGVANDKGLFQEERVEFVDNMVKQLQAGPARR
jgi:hypothetical protein